MITKRIYYNIEIILALLRLENTVRFTARGPLRPICLPDAINENYDGNRVRFACMQLKRMNLLICFSMLTK